jgi:hypothetical protein
MRRSRFAVVMSAGVVACGLALSAQETAAVFQGEAAEQFLSKGRLVQMRDVGVGVTAPQRVILEFEGVQRQAVFKTIDVFRPGLTQVGPTTEIDFQDSWQTEIAAYRIDRMLGLGMVPATVEGYFNGKRGSIQWWVESMTSEDGRRKQSLAPPDEEAFQREMLTMRLFDELIYNVDRHLNNILVTKEFHLRLIDHSRAFRPVDKLRAPAQLTRFSKAMLEALPKLEYQGLRKQMGNYLRDNQVRAMLKRRDAILELAKQRIAEIGDKAIYD